MRSHISCNLNPFPDQSFHQPWWNSTELKERGLSVEHIPWCNHKKWWKNPNIPHKICSEDDLRFTGERKIPTKSLFFCFFFRCFFLRAAHISFSKARFRSGFDTLNQQSTHKIQQDPPSCFSVKLLLNGSFQMIMFHHIPLNQGSTE